MAIPTHEKIMARLTGGSSQAITQPNQSSMSQFDNLRNKGEEITASKTSLTNKIFSKLPVFIQDVIGDIKEGLFGNEKDKAVAQELEKQGVKRPLENSMKTEGFLPFLGKSDSEKIEGLAQTLERKGVAPERASELAFYEVFSRGISTIPEELGKTSKAKEELRKLNPTDQEKKSLTLSRYGQAAGSALDITNVFPIGSISKKVVGQVGKKVAKELVPFAEETQKLTKDIFLKEFDAGLKSKNLTTKETAENVLKKIKESGFSSPDQFYDEVTSATKMEAPQPNTIIQAAKNNKESVETTTGTVSKLRQARDAAIEYVQDTDIRIKRLQERTGTVVTDPTNIYQKLTLMPGRIQSKVDDVAKVAESVISDLKKTGDELKLDLGTMRKQLSDYLHFKHAPERNAALGEKAAGITTDEATRGLKIIEESKQGAKIKELADRALSMNRKTLEVLKESGVISKELFSTLTEKYKSHVPLNRIFEETEDIAGALSSRGLDVKTTGLMRAKGSERQVSDILTNIVTNLEQAILRSEKNIVDNATLGFVRQNKDMLGNLFEISSPKAIGKTFKGVPIIERTNDPTVLQLFENGKRIWIKINDPALAVALRGVGKEKLGGLLQAVGNFTRFYAGLATRFNPEFALPNKLRDLQEVAVYLAAQKDVGFKGAAQVSARDASSFKDIMDFMRAKDTSGAKMYKEMKDAGGTTGGFGLSTRKKTEINLKNLEKLATSKTKNITNTLIEYVDNWNTLFEDSTRLSVYKQARAQGASVDRAAALAKEASVNFNRTGRGGPVINALWMFSNASIQGSTKMIRALKNPKVAGTVVAAVGSSVAAVNEWNDRIDPEWRDKVTKWDRLNGLPIMLPTTEGARYITVPVSWGIKPIKVMADYAYDAFSGQKIDTKQLVDDAFTSIAEAYNPVGGTDWISTLVPTILDTPVEIGRNLSWSGKPIKPDFDPNAPADIRYFASLRERKTGQVAISISEALRKGGVLVSPADINYGFQQYVGGAGRATTKLVDTITGIAGGEAPLDNYPIISRFYRKFSDEEVGSGAGGSVQDIKDILGEQSRERFNLKTQAESIVDEVKRLPQDQAIQRLQKLETEDKELADKVKETFEDLNKGLNYTDRLIKQLGVENGQRAKFIVSEVKKLKTVEEKAEYLSILEGKKVISKTVKEQIIYLLKTK